MNKQDAIEKLKALSRMFEEVPTGAVAEAISALEKQRPLKILYQETRELDQARVGICPSCKKWWIDEFKNYCPNCGQAIDWSMEDE